MQLVEAAAYRAVAPRCSIGPAYETTSDSAATAIQQSFPSLRLVGRAVLVAFFAREQDAEHTRAALRSDHPRPIGPRRIMAHVPVVAAVELGHPV
jgi:hypothetical protein